MTNRLAALLFLALAFSADACYPSTIIPGGCQIQGDAGVAVHYALIGTTAAEFAVTAETTGYVAIAFATNGQHSLFPSDAVVGWYNETGIVVEVQLNGNMTSEVLASGVPLTGANVTQQSGATILEFTRPLSAGRFPIFPESVTMFVAQGPIGGVFIPSDFGVVVANLVAGQPEPLPQPPVPPVPATPAWPANTSSPGQSPESPQGTQSPWKATSDAFKSMLGSFLAGLAGLAVIFV